MDFWRSFTPPWVLEVERLSKAEAERNRIRGLPRYARWAQVGMVLAGIAIFFGVVLVGVSTPHRANSAMLPAVYGWYGVCAFVAGIGLSVLCRRFGRQKASRIDVGDPENQ